jgi:biopolymer transport protein ExbD
MFQSVRGRRRSQTATEVNMAPLIDMVFILLIFFLVTTTFVRDIGLKVDKPQATFASNLDKESLRVGVAETGTIFVEGKRLGLDELKDRVRQFVLKEKSGAVIVIPDEKLSAGRLVAIMDAAKLGGARSISIATRQRKQ